MPLPADDLFPSNDLLPSSTDDAGDPPPTPTGVRLLNDRAKQYLGMIPPFMRESPVYQAIYNAAGGEDMLQEEMLNALQDNLIPSRATSDGLLSVWEAQLGLPIAPPGASQEQRLDAVLAFFQNVMAQGTGLEWTQAAEKLLGVGFEYMTHRPEENLVWDPNFVIPFPTSPWAGPLTTTGPTKTRTYTNLLTNPSFETDLASWYAQGTVAATLTRVTDEHYQGAAAMKVDMADGSSGVGVLSRWFQATDTTKTLRISVWVKGPAGLQINLKGNRYTSGTPPTDGNNHGAGGTVKTITLTGEWQKEFVDISSGATWGSIMLGRAGGFGLPSGPAASFWVDSATAVLNTDGQWDPITHPSFHGAMTRAEILASMPDPDTLFPQVTRFDVNWTGTAHASTSAISIRRHSSLDARPSGLTTSIVGGRLRFDIGVMGGSAFVTSPYFQAEPNRMYSVRAKRWNNTNGGENVITGVVFENDAGTVLQNSFIPQGSFTVGSSEDVRVFQSPAGTTRAYFYFSVAQNAGPGTSQVEFDQVMVAGAVNPDGTALPYGDGSTAGWEWRDPAQAGFSEFSASQIIGPPAHTILALIPYGQGSVSAALIEKLLRAITPANTAINVSYGEGFILDESQLDDDLF